MIDRVQDAVLEDQLAEAPEAVENYLVYADWLLARGHPRGQLINIQHQLAGDPDNAELLGVQQQLFERYGAQLFGERTSDFVRCDVEWRLGFWRSLQIELAPDATFTALEAMLTHPSARLLEELAVHGAADSSAELFGSGAELFGELAQRLDEGALPAARTLRSLALGSRAVTLRWSPAALEHALPRLERLELRTASVHHSYLDWKLPRLREYTLVSESLGPKQLTRLLKSLPKQLTGLTLDLITTSLPVSTLTKVLDGSKFPGLTRLGLLGFDDSLGIIEALLRSRLLPQLQAIGLQPSDGWWFDDALRERLQDPALASKQLFCSVELSASERYDFGLMLRTELGRPAEALVAFELALRDAPEDATTWMEHGSAHEDLGHTHEAERSYREALRLDPKLSSAWHNLAVCLKHQRRFAEALDAFQRSCEDSEPLASTLHCIGHMHQELGEHEAGERHLQQAIDGYTAMLRDDDDDDDDDGEVLFWRGAAHARLRRRSEALADLGRAIALDGRWREEARTEEDFVDMRDDPEFRALLANK